MNVYQKLNRFKKAAAVGVTGTMLALPASCDLGEFTTTSTVTLDGREVVSFLVRSWIMTPIQDGIDRGIDAFFDQFEDD